eukprot:5841016-Pyramimonas_sp.AAC.1
MCRAARVPSGDPVRRAARVLSGDPAQRPVWRGRGARLQLGERGATDRAVGFWAGIGPGTLARCGARDCRRLGQRARATGTP